MSEAALWILAPLVPPRHARGMLGTCSFFAFRIVKFRMFDCLDFKVGKFQMNESALAVLTGRAWGSEMTTHYMTVRPNIEGAVAARVQ